MPIGENWRRYEYPLLTELINYPYHRTSHKIYCAQINAEKNAYNMKRIEKLGSMYKANAICFEQLCLYIILAFDLLSSGGNLPQTPHMISINVIIEPIDMIHFMTLLLTDEDVPRPIQGMLQFTTIQPYNSANQIPEEKLELWRRFRKMTTDIGLVNSTTVLVEMVLGQSGMLSVVTITPEQLEKHRAVIENPLLLGNSVSKGVHWKRYTVETSIEYIQSDVASLYSHSVSFRAINLIIRNDCKRNEWLLQTPMTEEDIEIIRQARPGREDKTKSDAARNLGIKINREDLYSWGLADPSLAAYKTP